MPRGRKRLRARNPKRYAANLRRAYDSPERRAWVKTLPCVGCGVVGYSENAHVCGNDGAGRKGAATTIAPLCHDRFDVVGCHRKYDEHKPPFDREEARETVQHHATALAVEWARISEAA
jgi:hypothetical protein